MRGGGSMTRVELTVQQCRALGEYLRNRVDRGMGFGYDEIDTAYRPDPSLPQKTPEEEKADTIAWETRQLEIMDWLTDDVDWLTGQKHAPSRCIFRQNA